MSRCGSGCPLVDSRELLQSYPPAEDCRGDPDYTFSEIGSLLNPLQPVFAGNRSL
ncbi:MAG: hypothetical protein R3293_04025 [Candidatus Promineifilaceae bacterium]|nr:hypothetical protein [Candidatus Promineifilaceae bacterium]